MSEVSESAARDALSHIPANLPREEWVRVGMALKSEFSDDTGLQLFIDWSATADDFDEASVRSTWRSIKAGGGVRIGTLLRLAKEHGFIMSKPDQAAPAPSDAELARRRIERQQNRHAEQAVEAAAHQAAAEEAAQLWSEASPTGTSAYLARKGVQGHGVRYGRDGWLLVPVRDANDRLWNVQRIAPEKPAKGADKLFLKGGRKSGLWHQLGTLADASVVLVAEGYATAASVHEATGRPVAVAFDAGNLAHVARALRQQLPAVHLVLCGDDDVDTKARTGRNTGREKAEAAARVVQGVAVFAAGLPEGGSDFNDLHVALGLDAVRDQVEAAIARLPASTTTEQVAVHSDAVDPEEELVAVAAPKRRRAGKSDRPAGELDTPIESTRGDPFTCDAQGVWFHGRDREGNPARPM